MYPAPALSEEVVILNLVKKNMDSMSAHIHRDQEAVQVHPNLILHISLAKDKVVEQQACLNINV